MALPLGGPNLRCWLHEPAGSSLSTKSYDQGPWGLICLAANLEATHYTQTLAILLETAARQTSNNTTTFKMDG